MNNRSAANETILDRLAQHARTDPERLAYAFLPEGETPETICYRELLDRVLGVASRCRALGNPGDRALLLYPSGLDFIAGFLGCLAAGMIAVPAPLPRRNRPSERLQHIVNDADPRIVLTSTRVLRSHGHLPVLQSTRDRIVLATDDFVNDEESAPSWTAPELDSTAFLQYTSGSTGNPRGVIVSHRNIMNNEEVIRDAFGHTSDSIGCLWLPLFHDMGLIGGVLQPLYTGFFTVLMPPESFLRQPVRWLQAISKYHATTVGAPNFAYDYCVARINDNEKRDLDLSTVKVLFNGAEPVRADTLDRFVQAFSPCGMKPEAVYPCYGLAESTLLVAGGPREDAPRKFWVSANGLESRRVRAVTARRVGSRCLVSSGLPTLRTRLAIVDPESRAALPDDRIGEVWVSSGSVCRGYWNRPEESCETFRATLSNDPNGLTYLRTGDLGFMDSGHLFVTGRIKDLIIVHGRNVYPHDVEAAVERALDFSGTNSCAAFGVADEGEEKLALVVETTRALASRFRESGNGNGATANGASTEMRHLVDRLQLTVREEFEVPIHSITFLRPGALPRTSSGKVQRRVCRERLAAGTVDAVFQWSDGQRRRTADARVDREAGVAYGVSVGGVHARADKLPVPSDLCTTKMEPANGEFTGAAVRENEAARRKSSPRGNGKVVSKGRALRQLIVDIVTDYFRQHKGVEPEPVGFETSLFDLGIDSLGASAIALEIENATGQALTADIVFENRTIEELACYLERRARARQSSAGDAPAPGAAPRRRAADFVASLAERNRPVEQLKAQNQYFFETPISQFSASRCVVDGREMLMFSSFSYLGLVGHPELNQASIDAIHCYGGGAHGARLVAGTTVLHQELEARIAAFMAAEAAIVLGTGYMTNLATIQALVGKQDYVIGDEFNHASIVDGCTFSGADFVAYRHNDMDDLERRLQQSAGRRTLVVVDAVYSMEGDIARLPDIVRLCSEYDALLMVDEAHSLGVLGKTGRGVQEHFALPPDAIDIKMGTLSKGLASQGGFVAGSEEIITALKYHARGFVFSTAPPAPSIAAAAKALEILQREPERVERLRHNTLRLLNGLRAVGLKTTHTVTPIIPVLGETTEKTLAMTAACREAGLFVVPVFYPVVPMNSPRIRLNVTAGHSDDEIDTALGILARAGREAGVIR